MLAITGNRLNIAQLLIRNGFDPFVTIPAPRGWNLLYFAVATKELATVQFCLDLGLSPCKRVTV